MLSEICRNLGFGLTGEGNQEYSSTGQRGAFPREPGTPRVGAASSTVEFCGAVGSDNGYYVISRPSREWKRKNVLNREVLAELSAEDTSRRTQKTQSARNVVKKAKFW